MSSEKKFSCKECYMKFDSKERLERHFIKAHPPKQKFVNPNEYWHDSGAGI